MSMRETHWLRVVSTVLRVRADICTMKHGAKTLSTGGPVDRGQSEKSKLEAE